MRAHLVRKPPTSLHMQVQSYMRSDNLQLPHITSNLLMVAMIIMFGTVMVVMLVMVVVVNMVVMVDRIGQN